MKYYLALILASLVVLSCNSDNYDIKTTSNGKVYRIDKVKGDVYEITNGKLLKIASYEEANLSALSKPKLWPRDTTNYSPYLWPLFYESYDLPNLDSIRINLVTSWREGTVYYRFNVSPFTEKLEEARNSYLSKFTISFSDINQFELLELELPLNSLTRTVDSDGKSVNLSVEGKIDCSADIYEDLNNISVAWNFK